MLRTTYFFRLIGCLALSCAALLFLLFSSAVRADQRFAIIGDFGSTTAATNVANRLTTFLRNPFVVSTGAQDSFGPTFITTVGDNNYTNNWTQTGFDADIGGKYGAYIKGAQGTLDTATTNNFYPTLGNHDISNTTATGSSGYTAYFDLTNTNDSAISSSSGNERYYDVVRGDAHLFMLHANNNASEPDGNNASSVQRTWYNTRLAASTSVWNLTFFHQPAYSTQTSGDHGSNTYMQWGFSSGGKTSQVIYNGHAHDLERTLDTSTGQMYVVDGTGGQSTDTFSLPVLTGTIQTLFRDQSNTGPPANSAHNGFSLVDTSNLHLTSKHFTQNGNLLDKFTLVAPGAPALQTKTFQQGVSGYTGTLDTELREDGIAVSSSATTVSIDGTSAAHRQSLVRFDSIIGTGASQVPLGAKITSATLKYNISDPGSGMSIYRMVQSWNSSATWAGFGGGVQTDGIEALSTHEITVGTNDGAISTTVNVASTANTLPVIFANTFKFDVTASVQAFANGTTNNGWLMTYLTSGTNNLIGLSSADAGANAPQLEVEYLATTFAYADPSAINFKVLKGAASPTFVAQVNNTGVLDGIATYTTTGAATTNVPNSSTVTVAGSTNVTIGTSASMSTFGTTSGSVIVSSNGSQTRTINVTVGEATAATSGANNLNSFDANNALTAPIGGSGSYAGLASRTTPGGTVVGTTATIVQGRNAVGGANEDVTMNWRDRANVEKTGGATSPPIPIDDLPTGLISDVVKLSGMSHSSGATSGDRVRTDPFTLQMSYSPALLQGDETLLAQAGKIHLAWLDTNYDGTPGAAATDLWKLATLGNFVNGSTPIVNYLNDFDLGGPNAAGSWDNFVAQYGVTDANLGTFVGSYGVDITNNVVWAVLDHNSQFSVLPEPSTLVLFGLGGLGLIGLARRRKAA